MIPRLELESSYQIQRFKRNIRMNHTTCKILSTSITLHENRKYMVFVQASRFKYPVHITQNIHKAFPVKVTVVKQTSVWYIWIWSFFLTFIHFYSLNWKHYNAICGNIRLITITGSFFSLFQKIKFSIHFCSVVSYKKEEKSKQTTQEITV